MKNYYHILGLSEGASVEEIKRAYRKLAKKYHPDRHQDEEEKKHAQIKMAEINEAKDKLLKPDEALDLSDLDAQTAFEEYEKGHDWFNTEVFEQSIKQSQDIANEAAEFLKRRAAKQIPLSILIHGGKIDELIVPANTQIGTKLTMPDGKQITVALKEEEGVEYYKTHFIFPYPIEASLLYQDSVEVNTTYFTSQIDLTQIKGEIGLVLADFMLLGLPVYVYFKPYVSRK